MSFNEKTGKMNWKDEFVWMLISIISGLLLSFLFLYFQRFPEANNFVIVLICCIAFYVLSILVRIQNHRGQALTGKPGFDEKKLKYYFPIPGFVVGIALLLF
jgi:uncharacterized membrane protein YfcA